MDSGGQNINKQGANTQPVFNRAPQFNAPAAQPNAAPQLPDFSANNFNARQEAGADVLRSYERQIGPSVGGGTQQVATIVPQPAPQIATAKPVNAAAAIAGSAPATAADSDKIEQEWVDAAKKVLAKTRADPYLQAQAVAALKRDYIKKRYGKEVGKAPDDAV